MSLLPQGTGYVVPNYSGNGVVSWIVGPSSTQQPASVPSIHEQSYATIHICIHRTTYSYLSTRIVIVVILLIRLRVFPPAMRLQCYRIPQQTLTNTTNLWRVNRRSNWKTRRKGYTKNTVYICLDAFSLSP